jgi:hypothetical protein
VLAPIKVFVSREPSKFSGSDVDGLQKLGVPVLTVNLDASLYFDIHHSADDTLDKVDRAGLDKNVAVWAAALYAAAEGDVDFRAGESLKP